MWSCEDITDQSVECSRQASNLSLTKELNLGEDKDMLAKIFLVLMKMSVWSECIYRWALSLTKEPNLGEDVAATENPRLPLNGEEISMHL